MPNFNAMLVMKTVCCFLFVVFSLTVAGQKVSEKIGQAYQRFVADSQLRSAISSLYVINAKTGAVVFDKNGKVGLATASTMKVITAASAYQMLGKDFRYETQFNLAKQNDQGVLIIKPSGDPSFGSWRWTYNNRFNVIYRITKAVQDHKLAISKAIIFKLYEDESIPGGWIWEDIGNYYGAGAQDLNWNENQYDLILKSGNEIGSRVEIVNTNPKLYSFQLESFAVAAAKGTGDNAYIYYPSGRQTAVVRGTIPVNEEKFLISGSLPHAGIQLMGKLRDTLADLHLFNSSVELPDTGIRKIIYTHSEYSPKLDSLIYWFLKKSINLYGEAFVKTIALKTTTKPTTDSGIDTIVSFWKQKGIDPVELRMVDGSGLSPLNRVTTHAQVQVLQYAKTQSWFKGYFDAFPEYNGMKIKSGTINGVKGFCGYHKAKDGNEYIFSFLVNNYNGSASEIVKKMYKVLDELK
jgi:serine-type D-Ala-D-Ala carboxypeptidase/endopeptidase (penicillin-binding protein 4)